MRKKLYQKSYPWWSRCPLVTYQVFQKQISGLGTTICLESWIFFSFLEPLGVCKNNILFGATTNSKEGVKNVQKSHRRGFSKQTAVLMHFKQSHREVSKCHALLGPLGSYWIQFRSMMTSNDASGTSKRAKRGIFKGDSSLDALLSVK